MNKEILSYVIRNRKPVTSESLRRAKIDVSRQADVYFSGKIQNITRVNLETINATYDYVVGQFYNSVQEQEGLLKKFGSIDNSVNLRFYKILRNIDKANAELAAMSVLYRDAAGYVDTVNIDLSSKSAIDINNSTASIIDGIVVGLDKEPSTSSSEFVQVSKYQTSNFSVSLSQIQKTSNGGIYVDDVEFENLVSIDIVNTGLSFYASAQSTYDTPAEMTIKLDRKEFSPFDNINFEFMNAFICDVLVSDDDQIYKKLTNKEFYGKAVNLRTVSRTARYIKIILHFTKPSYQDGGNFIYRADFKYLNVIRQTIEGTYTLLTQQLQVPGEYSAVALGVCDNQISSLNSAVAIDYYIQLNGSAFERIRPANQLHSGEELVTSSLKLPRYIKDEVINIKGKSTNYGYYDYNLAENYTKFYQAQERFFASRITYTAKDWKDAESYYECFAMLTAQKEIDFGTEEIEVNGQWVTGKRHLQDGIYKIRTFKENYLNQFNTWKAKQVVFDRIGLYAIDDGNGNLVTIQDSKYPNNHKVIVESQFDEVFSDELRDIKDFSWYLNADGTYSLHSTKHYSDGIYIIYRPYTSFLNTIKVKAVMRSNDKTTLPTISKMMLRLQ